MRRGTKREEGKPRRIGRNQQKWKGTKRREEIEGEKRQKSKQRKTKRNRKK